MMPVNDSMDTISPYQKFVIEDIPEAKSELLRKSDEKPNYRKNKRNNQQKLLDLMTEPEYHDYERPTSSLDRDKYLESETIPNMIAEVPDEDT